MPIRLAYITVPVSLLIAAGGVYLASIASERNIDPAFRAPRHPVTAEMLAEVGAKERKAAPLYELKTWDGKPLSMTKLVEKGPVVVVAIKDGCPCSYESQPYFNQMAKAYAGKASFVGVIWGDGPLASKWMSDMSVPFPVVPDPNKIVLTGYGFPRSVYTTLVNGDGKIVKTWPGWSRDMLIEMSEAISSETGAPLAKIDLKGAPLKANSGCTFE
jgi:peroxiredoxin